MAKRLTSVPITMTRPDKQHGCPLWILPTAQTEYLIRTSHAWCPRHAKRQWLICEDIFAKPIFELNFTCSGLAVSICSRSWSISLIVFMPSEMHASN